MVSVLLIDDDYVERMLVDSFLNNRYGHAYSLRWADSLEASKTMLEKNRFDVVLLDNRLKRDQNFRETLPQVAARANGSKIYVISTCTEDVPESESRRGGAAAVVNKFALSERIAAGMLG